MPSIRVMALCEFFFPRPRRTRRSARSPRIPAVNISGTNGANIYSRVWMSSTPASGSRSRSQRGTPLPVPPGHGSRSSDANNFNVNIRGRGPVSVELDEDEPPSDDLGWGIPGFVASGWGSPRPNSRSRGWPDCPHESGEDAQPRGFDAGNVFRDRPARTPARTLTRDLASGRQGQRNASGRGAQHSNNNNNSHNDDNSRFSAYDETLRQAESCFVGDSHLHAEHPDFHDQAIRFRVIDTTGGGGGERPREMIVVSSPQNMQTVVDILAPRGSGRVVVCYARDPDGWEVQTGGRQFLAETVLPAGWPFDLVIEES